MPAVIGTWKFSEVGVCAASRMLEVGRTAADAVEEGIRVVELDESCHSVGYGGIPNADGVLQLDAGFMNGDGGCGAVMALEGYRTAIGVARRVMERSVHTVFAGRGAKKFAESIGLQSEPSASLITPHARQRYEEYLSGAVIEVRENILRDGSEQKKIFNPVDVALISMDTSSVRLTQIRLGSSAWMSREKSVWDVRHLVRLLKRLVASVTPR